MARSAELNLVSCTLPDMQADGANLGRIAEASGVEQVLWGIAVGHAAVRYSQSGHLDNDPPLGGTALTLDCAW
jgi:hypothetical protein